MGSFRPKAHAATPLGCSRIGLAAAFLIGTTIPLATRDRDAIAAVAAVRSATPKGTAGASYGLGFGATQFLGGAPTLRLTVHVGYKHSRVFVFKHVGAVSQCSP